MTVTENESWFAELRGSAHLGSSHTLTLGTAFRTDKSDTNSYDIPFFRSYDGASASTFYAAANPRPWSVFAQEEWRIAEPLTLYAGLRYDSWKVYDGSSGEPGELLTFDSNTESEISPKLAAVWKALQNTTVKASVGHGFRPPTLYELYRTWTSYATPPTRATPIFRPKRFGPTISASTSSFSTARPACRSALPQRHRGSDLLPGRRLDQDPHQRRRGPHLRHRDRSRAKDHRLAHRVGQLHLDGMPRSPTTPPIPTARISRSPAFPSEPGTLAWMASGAGSRPV